jgi:hypothetical protein
MTTEAVVAAVWASPTHSFSKFARDELLLVQGKGFARDAHCARVASSGPAMPST